MFKQLVCGAAILGMAVSNAWSQARIVDSQPDGRNQSSNSQASRSQNPAVTASSAQTELYYQVQLLQEEVQELRGLVEQQSYELKRLQQQRLDDYLDLDRRVSQLSSVGDAPLPGPATPAAPRPQAEQIEDAAPLEELSSYRSAIDLVLKQRDFDAGIEALKAHLQRFPSGHYAANAQYWLGQIYLQKSELSQSREWFARMIKEHPSHQKTPEAKFKLGKVHHLLGNTSEAKKILQEVAKANVAVASLAEDYLKQNF